MGRVINTNNPGKRRNHAMRSIAEILRRLGQRQGDIDDDVRDMVAMIVFCLREIDATVLDSIKAWEKRGYWNKADKFQMEWMWAGQLAKTVEEILFAEDWDQFPEIMMKLFPHFSDIEVNKMTRDSSLWIGSYDMLLKDLNK